MPSFSPTIETQRLILRPLSHKDAQALFGIFSDPDVMKYWITPPWASSEEATRYINKAIDHARDQVALTLGIFLKETDRLIGRCALFEINRQQRRGAIGYGLDKEYWGNGYMPEAARALLDYGFDELRLRRIGAEIDPENHASARTLEKLGFMHEGRLRQQWELQGRLSDSDIYGLLKTDKRHE